MWEWNRPPEEGDARWYETKGMHDLRQAYAIAVREAPAEIYRETGYAVGEFVKDILPALLDLCAVQAASTAIGAGVGGLIGSLGAGVGAVPGAAYGAGVGFSVGATILTWLGLTFLFIAVKKNIGEVIVLVQLAVNQAWHAAEHPISRSAQVEYAGHTLARAMGRLMLLILQAIVAWLFTRGMGNASELYADLRKSKLGDGFTTWVEQNIERLRNDARLQPRQVEGSTAKETAEAKALTPSQLVKMQQKTPVPDDRTGNVSNKGNMVDPAKSYGVAFFGDSNLGYYTRDGATIGRDGKSFFFMPIEDSPMVKNSADAARYTGRAPSAEAAYLSGGDVYGLSFPTDGMPISRPTAADAGWWPHFLEGGNTAVRLGDGPNTGYLVNPTREFVIPGGNQVPSGSVLFRLGPNGEWMPVTRF